jgi:hypothetical protein
MLKLIAPVLLSLTVLLGASPARALAHGPALKGMEIDRNTVVTATTGNCSCQDRWYTVGLDRGTATITATVQDCQSNLIKLCVAEAFLLRNTSQLAGTHVVCHHLAHCGLSRSITYHVKQKGAYYVLVQGSGSLLIHYTLRLHGHVYALHCRKYC